MVAFLWRAAGVTLCTERRNRGCETDVPRLPHSGEVRYAAHRGVLPRSIAKCDADALRNTPQIPRRCPLPSLSNRTTTEIPICQRHQALSATIRAPSLSDADRLDCVRMLTCNLDGFDPHFEARTRSAAGFFSVGVGAHRCVLFDRSVHDTESRRERP